MVATDGVAGPAAGVDGGSAHPLPHRRLDQVQAPRAGHLADALAATMKCGHATASLLLARLHAGARRNASSRALHEYGRLVRTVFVLRYRTDLELRRRVQRQRNEGEGLHALRRRLFFAHRGQVRRRHLDDQVDQALCLTIVTNAVVLRNTVYLADALDHLRRGGLPIPDEAAAHLSPARDDHVNPYGSYTFDVGAELTGSARRPLRGREG